MGNVASTKAWLSSRWTALPPGIRIAQRTAVGSGTSNLGKHQIGCAENGEVGDNWRHLGNDLHRRGPGADDPDALAGQVLGVIPACGVHGDAFKRVHPVDVG